MTTWFPAICGVTFMPHGHCYLWAPGLVRLHAIADSLIALAYFSIPVLMLYFVRKRRDLPFPKIFLMFGAFIVACGTTHIMEIVTIWQPVYWLSGAVKLATAGISLAAALALVRVVPAALQLPSPDDLRRLNATLEQRVQARTADLTAANESLRREADQREHAEAEVRRLNTELQSRLAELHTLFQLLPVGVGIATDTTCRKIRFNRAYAEIHGLPVESGASFSAPPHEIPVSCRLLHNGRELAPDDVPMRRAVTGNTPVLNFEKSILRQDGVAFEVIANAVPVRDEQGRPRGCVATVQDISAHKRAERERLEFERKLLQSQKLESIGVLAGGIAHDFNNLLTGILGHANLARLQLASGAAAVDPLLAHIETAAQRAAELCRQLLAYAGKGRFIVRTLDLNTLVSEAQTLLKLSVSKKVTLELQLAENLPPFRGDASQINQVLMNLAINASEAIGDRVGTITIRTQRIQLAAMDMLTLSAGCEIVPGDYLCLAVGDTGCGIPPEAMTHIFEPFFTTKFVGRGLGLSGVLGIMQGHHGAMRVSSQVGLGSTFELFFPVVRPGDPATAVSTPPDESVSAPARAVPQIRGTVLVVDDEESVREFATTALATAGLAVVTAENGEIALAHLRHGTVRFDAVLLDLTMPKLDGEDTLFALRMIAPDLPVVLTSGYHELALAQQFVGRGLAAFLPKPFVADTLVNMVSVAIAERRERQNPGN